MAKRKLLFRIIIIVVPILILLNLFGSMLYIEVYHLITGKMPSWVVTGEVQDERIAAFSFDEVDPAGYWGEYSMSVEMKHERFDRVVFTPYSERLGRGFVIVGLREGRIACFYIRAILAERLVINGKSFRWIHHYRSDRLPSGSIAKGLTKQEVDDLRAISTFLLGPTGRAELSSKRSGITDWLNILGEFDEYTKALAEAKEKIRDDGSIGTSPTEGAPSTDSDTRTTLSIPRPFY